PWPPARRRDRSGRPTFGTCSAASTGSSARTAGRTSSSCGWPRTRSRGGSPPSSIACCRSSAPPRASARSPAGRSSARSSSPPMLSDNLGHLFDAPLRLAPSSPALFQDDVRLTYAELDTRCNRVATGLARLGVGAGARVALMFSNDFRFLESLFGPMRLGAVTVPLNTRMGDDALRYVVEDAEATV